MEDNREFLGTEPIGKLLFRLAVPTVIAQLVNVLYNMVDRIYIGHIPENGSLMLTGLGVCSPIILIVSAFASLASSGGAPKASIAMGKKDTKEAEKILGNCFSMQIGIALLLTAVLLIWDRPMLLAFGGSANTIEYAVSYMNIYAVGTVFVLMTLGMNAFITAQGFAKQSMLTVLIGAVCNIILDPIFIFALNMGVRGAALATVISQGISCVWVLCFLMGKKTQLHLRAENMKIDWSLLLPCAALGTATFIMMASESLLQVCFNSSLLKYGGDTAVGAMTILLSVTQIAMMPLSAIGQGAQPISSYNFGAKNVTRVKKTFRLLLRTDLIYSAVLWAAVMLFPKVFAGIFSSDSELTAFTARAMQIYCACIVLFGIQMACQMTFVSTGNAGCSIIVAVVRKFILLIPMIYLVPAVCGALGADRTMGVYLAEPISDFIAVSFTAILFAVQFRKAMKKLEESSRKRIHVAAAVIYDDNHRIFAAQRGYGDQKDGWEFPGGKPEEGETPQDALKREIREELDTEIEVEEKIGCVEYDYPKFHLTMDCFVCRIVSGDPVLKEHEASRWLDSRSLEEVDWLPPDRMILKDVRERMEK